MWTCVRCEDELAGNNPCRFEQILQCSRASFGEMRVGRCNLYRVCSRSYVHTAGNAECIWAERRCDLDSGRAETLLNRVEESFKFSLQRFIGGLL